MLRSSLQQQTRVIVGLERTLANLLLGFYVDS